MYRKMHARRAEAVNKHMWIEIENLSAKYKAVNLYRGVPDFAPPNFVVEAFCNAASGGNQMHQYTRTLGHPPLVNILAKLFGRILGRNIDPMDDIVITVGAYEAIFCAVNALVDEDDEVIILEPFYDCYGSMTVAAGGKPVYIPLTPQKDGGSALSSADWKICPEELASKFNHRTKAIIINNPNNPLGKVFGKEELQMIANLCIKHDVICISDEVYEWFTYDGAKHIKIASISGMWERTVTIGSAGKVFRTTGWKVGWAIGSSRIMKYLQSIHQNTICQCATVAQEAVAVALEREYKLFGKEESYFNQFPLLLKAKWVRLAECLRCIGLQPLLPEGGYFMTVNVTMMEGDLNDQNSKHELYDFRFAKWLIKEKGLSAMPVSAFFSTEHKADFQNYVRFCFVKDDSTLDAAERIMKMWHN